MSKPVVPVRGTAHVFYNEGAKCFQFSGVIGLGHPRLAEGVSIRSSRIQEILNPVVGKQVIVTLNTVYECDEIVFDEHQPQALSLGKNLTKNDRVVLA